MRIGIGIGLGFKRRKRSGGAPSLDRTMVLSAPPNSSSVPLHSLLIGGLAIVLAAPANSSSVPTPTLTAMSTIVLAAPSDSSSVPTPPALVPDTDLQFWTFMASATWTPTTSGLALVQCRGAGAGGTTNTRAGGGGAYARVNAYAYTATGYGVVVGTSTAATAGGNSTFNTSTCVGEGGGQSGTLSDGGRAANSTGDVTFSGGAGGVGAGNQNGGGSAGSANNGSGLSPGEPDGARGGGANSTTSAKNPGGGGFSTTAAQRAGASGLVSISTAVTSTGTYPDHETVSANRDATTNTVRNISLPAGSGGVLRLFIANTGTATASIPGWTQVGTDVSTTGRLTVLEIASTGSESIVLTTSATALVNWICIRVKHGSGAAAGVFTNATTANVDPPNYNPGVSVARRWYVGIALLNSTTSGQITALPSGYTQGIYRAAPTNTSMTLLVCWRDATAASENPAAVVSPASEHAVCTLGIERTP